METALAILALGAVDAVITQILRDTKNQNKVMLLRVSMYATVVIIVAPEIIHLFQYTRRVFGV